MSFDIYLKLQYVQKLVEKYIYMKDYKITQCKICFVLSYQTLAIL